MSPRSLGAVAKSCLRCWLDSWVFDLDMREFFDVLDHALVMRAAKRLTTCNWTLLYIARWLQADVQLQGGTLLRGNTGAPEGGVISQLVANIFLDLGFGQWTREYYSAIHLGGKVTI